MDKKGEIMTGTKGNKVSFTERDTSVVCKYKENGKICGRPIKVNVVSRKKNVPNRCYKHWILKKEKSDG